ncbi:histone-lysine N-methyltransferase NSD2-like [Acanthaster planci]|uniref:Histone-lysine N-methyltransferase NSD2-like n=1 Tax=Acanthaster planci TaxID=133434 RepID=A0A8B7YET3_ACAPL|nr:histone-lysine N-methyltransferase NSD2-like [Acanthaster planci]XP_022091754.1 histone-lysine N-methyltransferase NSD2-like [Acanthaster planci]
MGTTHSQETTAEEGSFNDLTHKPSDAMNPSDQRNILPQPPPLYPTNNDSSVGQGSYGSPAMQGMASVAGYPGSSQSYSHIPINPVPGPPYHKIAQPMRSQEPMVSQQSMYQQYPQQSFGQSTYSQSYSQQFYPQSSYQSYNAPMHTMQQQSYIQPHMPYQQSQPHSSPQKYMYQQPYQQDQNTALQQPQMPVAKPQMPIQPQPQVLPVPPPNQPQPYQPQPMSQTQPPSSIYQPPVVENASLQPPNSQMNPPQKPSTPPSQIQPSKDPSSVMPTPPSDSAPSETSDVPPGSPEIKLTIKKTFDKGRPRLTSSLAGKEANEKTDAVGSGSEMSKEEEQTQSDPGPDTHSRDQPSPTPSKPKTVAQKRENFKVGKAAVLPKPTLQANPPPTSFDEKPCEWLVGDLVWSKVTGHPWWPCMVAYDPNLGIYTRMKGAYGKSYRMYHVQFFGEVPERGWVSGCSMRKFIGRSQYDQLVQELVAKVKRKDRTRMMAKLALKPSRKSAWETSVVECEKALPMSRHERKLKFTFKYEIPKSATGSLSGEQIDIVSLGDSPKMKAKRAYKKQQDSEAAAATTKVSSQDLTQSSTASISTPDRHDPTGNPPSDDDNPILPVPRTKRKYQKRKSSDRAKTSPVKDSPRTKRKRGRKSFQYLAFCSKHTEELTSQHPDKSKVEINALLEDKWEEMTEEEKAKYGTSPARATPATPRRARKRKVQDQSPELDVVVKRSRRETKPSKKLQEADLDNLGFSPKMTKSLKLNDEESENKRSRSTNTLAVTPTPDGKEIDASVKKRRRGRKTKHLTNGDPVLNRVPVKPVKTGGEAIATEMSKDFAEMQEDEPGLIIDTDLITGAIESAVDGPDNTNGVPFSISGHSSGDEQASTSNASQTSSTNGAAREKGAGAAKKENVCQVCEGLGELLLCEGGCCGAFHLDCIGLQTTPSGTFKCDECISGVHSCFVCKVGDKTVKRCHVGICGKYYHEDCVKKFSRTRIDNRGFTCPLHTCTSCFADNPKNPKASKGRLVRCVRCPASFHAGDSCIAAGSITLASNSIVCSHHFKPIKTQKHHARVSVSWCFICSVGGDLICCDSCPAAFHASCIGISSIPEGNWYCRDCSNGKRPRYNDIIWVKLGNYRWWPAQVCNPRNVPTNIQEMNHQVGEFPVQFFGSHDYFWTHQGRVFAYHEGDKGSRETAASRGLATVFKAALCEAAEKYKQWKGFREQKEARELENSSKKPRPFKFIKTNKPVGRVQMPPFDISKCQPCDCKPTSENPCGKDSDCLNRILLIECHPLVCPAGDKCQNQRFQKREYPESRPEKMSKRGWGLMSLVDIKKGDFVNEYVGELVDEEECRERIRQAHDNNITDFYFLTLDKDRIIDAGPKGNLSRFMNHCCQPNCETQKWTVNGDTRVGLFAICDIPCNTELTFNYNLDCLGNEKKRCECGAPNCSGFIGVRPKTASAEAVAEKYKKAANRKKLKRRKRKMKMVVKVNHDDVCFRCGEGGELVMCDHKNCPKAYCLGCLKLAKPPHGKWICPWHHCDECGKLATQLCDECPNSYCNGHSEGNIAVYNEMRLCKDHDDEDREQLMMQRRLKEELREIEKKQKEEEEEERRKNQEEKLARKEKKMQKKEKLKLKEKRKERKKEKRQEKTQEITEAGNIDKNKVKKRRNRTKKSTKEEAATKRKAKKLKQSKTLSDATVTNSLPPQEAESPEDLGFLLEDSEAELVIDEDFQEKKTRRTKKGQDKASTATAVPKSGPKGSKSKNRQPIEPPQST